MASRAAARPAAPGGLKAIVASRIYLPEGGAGAYRLAALVKALNDANFTTTVVTTQPPSSRQKSTREIRRWPVLRDRSGTVRGYLQYASFDIPLLFRLLVAGRPDVVIVEPPPTTALVCRAVCALWRIPYVYFAGDVMSTASAGIGVNKVVVRLLRLLESWTMKGAAQVMAVSEGVRDEVLRLGVSPARVHVVGTGIDTELFSMSGGHADVDGPYFVYAGTMSEIHGAGVFVEAFGRIAPSHPTAQLIMFGRGTEFEELRARAEIVAGSQIQFRGFVGGEEIARWLRGARAGLASVRPGRGYDFAYATKTFTSISCGTPVLYAGVGAARAAITDGNLGWVTDWDVEQVAAAMESALRTELPDETRRRLSTWADENSSLNQVGTRAVEAVIAALEAPRNTKRARVTAPE